MQKHQLYINLFAITSALALAACADEVDGVVTPDTPEVEVGEKTPIELSVGGVDLPSSGTRATITTGEGRTLQGFDENTSLYMLMKSEDITDGSSKSPLVTRTVMVAQPKEGSNIYSKVNYSETGTQKNQYDDFVRYWDDSYARSSALSVLAVCTPGMGYGVDKKAWNISSSDASYVKHGWNTITGGSGTAPYTSIAWPIGNTDNSTNQSVFSKDKKNQDVSFIKNQDLCFSNNIGKHGETDRRLKYDQTAKKFPREEDKWEDNATFKTRMIFYHALSKLTFQIKAGDSFTASETFSFESGENISLTGFYNQGTFDIEEGEFINNETTKPSSSKITKIYQHPTTDVPSEYKYILDALVIPGTDITIDDNSSSASDTEKANAKNAVTFTINGNKYIVSRKQLYDAILNKKDASGNYVYSKDNGTTVDGEYLANKKELKAGVHYVFTFTINKTQISNITASVVDWEQVVAEEHNPSNAYVTLSLKTNEGTSVNSSDPQVDLYRAKDPTSFTGSDYAGWAQYSWNTGYTAEGSKANLSLTSTVNVYTAKDASQKDASNNPIQWYWPNNETYYHFRTINKGLTVTSGDDDVISIYSGPIKDTYSATDISKEFADGKFNDYLWGAPFKSTVTGKTVYSTETGFCNAADNKNGQIYHAIGATTGNIWLIQHHMMSNIYVDLETTTGDDKVDLSGATVKIVRFAKDANIQMGNGLVTRWSSFDEGTGTAMTSDVGAAVTSGDNQHPAYDYSYRMVPQSLTYGTGTDTKHVGIEITTSDGNVYKINDLSQQKIKNTDPASYITEWLPGKKYYYKFVLKKTGIDEITATIVNWENVEADEDTVVIQ